MVQPSNSLFTSFKLPALVEGRSLMYSWCFGVHSHFFGSDEMHSGDLQEVRPIKIPHFFSPPHNNIPCVELPILSNLESALGSPLVESLGR